MSQVTPCSFIYILYGSRTILKQYNKVKDSLLLADPFNFCIKKYSAECDSLEIINDAILYENYKKISAFEYLKYHQYQCGALDLIFTERLLNASRQNMNTKGSK